MSAIILKINVPSAVSLMAKAQADASMLIQKANAQSAALHRTGQYIHELQQRLSRTVDASQRTLIEAQINALVRELAAMRGVA